MQRHPNPWPLEQARSRLGTIEDAGAKRDTRGNTDPGSTPITRRRAACEKRSPPRRLCCHVSVSPALAPSPAPGRRAQGGGAEAPHPGGNGTETLRQRPGPVRPRPRPRPQRPGRASASLFSHGRAAHWPTAPGRVERNRLARELRYSNGAHWRADGVPCEPVRHDHRAASRVAQPCVLERLCSRRPAHNGTFPLPNANQRDTAQVSTPTRLQLHGRRCVRPGAGRGTAARCLVPGAGRSMGAAHLSSGLTFSSE
jgi:hypothetical protein